MSDNALKTPPTTKPHILICDDDIAFSSELIEALQERGFAATALLTVSAMRAAILGPSILLLDLCMPGRDGIEILKILSEHERKDHFKILLVSGWDEQELAAAAKLCQCYGLQLLGTARKPVNINKLCELLLSRSDHRGGGPLSYSETNGLPAGPAHT